MTFHRGLQTLLFTTCALSAVAFLSPGARGAQLSGSIQTSDGKPVPQAPIAINIRPTTGTSQPFSATVYTSANGSFTASGIPAGTFAVCPQSPGADLLSPCLWQAVPPTVTVTANQTLSMPPLVMKKGVHLPIRINDPLGARAAAEGKVPGATIFAAIRTPSGFVVPALVVGRDASGYDHDIVIAPDTALQLTVTSKAFALAAGQGNIFPSQVTAQGVGADNGAVIQVNVPSGTTPAKIVFSITGRN